MKTLLLSLIMMAAFTSAYGQKSKTLVVYYSRTGNTEVIAKHVQSLMGADIFRVETAKPYPEGYHETTEVAKEEKNNNARPAIKSKVENIDRYDTVFIGFPVWWGTYPMAIATFMDEHHLEGKTIVPFCTHGGGGVDKGFTDLAKAAPKATHKDGLSLHGNRANASHNDVEKWLREIKLMD